ncbi:Trk system potassium transporter TrkA [Thermus thermophilus]|uniref:Trk system potassium uptake protein TrkA n=1 Tax=Thermus thermophilus (strain ATCC BAA-163 / DSM 7039 / HB27) TaxID=262724 RepID=Q72JG2_THET2|nr:Trk system potassium transporter TrkA [Thermus thermophilus]AAS81156.1 trk system potassium uptake protein trkA [Thermus thermophilus HB27]QMV30867.1 Trk system potassium transporter TrkA [Thermus thermophilus]WMV96193.1 Trk system potassium transporter TrkA [Thermus thermophilus HB27]
MYIVIAGGGEMGGELARALEKTHDVVVIDRNPQARERFASWDVKVVVGGATDPDTLREAGVDRADLFVASTDSDEINLLASLLAKGLGAKEAFCFVGKGGYVEVLTDPRTAEILGTRIDRVLWPQRAMAREIVEVILVPWAVDTEVLAGGRLRFVEYRVKEGGEYVHRLLSGEKWPEGVLLAGVVREGTFLSFAHPEFPELILEPGDKLLFVATQKAFSELAAYFTEGPGVRRVMVIGGGNVGFMVAQGLLKRRVEVVIVERNAERCQWLSEELPGALVIQGDGTDIELLEAEGMAEADAVVAVTDHDEKNLLASLLAKQMGVRKVITRVSRSETRRLFEQVGIDLALTPRQAAVREVLDWIGPENVEHIATLEESIEVLEVLVSEGAAPKALRDLVRPDAVPVALERDHRIFLYEEGLGLLPGDRLYLVAAREVADEVLAPFFPE